MRKRGTRSCLLTSCNGGVWNAEVGKKHSLHSCYHKKWEDRLTSLRSYVYCMPWATPAPPERRGTPLSLPQHCFSGFRTPSERPSQQTRFRTLWAKDRAACPHRPAGLAFAGIRSRERPQAQLSPDPRSCRTPGHEGSWAAALAGPGALQSGHDEE